MVQICNHILFSCKKKNNTAKFSGKLKQLENTLSEVIDSQKDKYSFSCAHLNSSLYVVCMYKYMEVSVGRSQENEKGLTGVFKGKGWPCNGTNVV